MSLFAEIDGQRIHYTDSGGDGPVVILAHGFLMDHEMFEPQVSALAPEFRVITWDERGFGLTEYDGQPFTYWDSARDLLGLMDHLGIDSAVVGGMSQGGFISLRAALTAPDRVQALVLLDTAADVDDADTLAAYGAMVDTWLAAGPAPELLEVIAGIIISDDAESPRWIAKWAAREPASVEQPSACLLGRDDISDRLGEITCPALVVHGAADAAISMDRAVALADGLSGADQVVAIDGAGHSANLTHAHLVNPPLMDFLRRVTG